MLKYLLLLFNIYITNAFVINSKNLYNYKFNSNSLSVNKNFKMNMLSYNSEKFNFKKQWYPVNVLEFMDKKKPHVIYLLGKKLVAWHNGYKWNVFEDECPHRLAPLSEGRIEKDGNLFCSYHGFRYNSTGNCVSLPYAKDINDEIKLNNLKRSCAKVYPVKELQELLWVWGESGEPGSDNAIEASLKKPNIIHELENINLENARKNNKLSWNPMVKDIPCSWDYFIENTLDFAHATTTHHGIAGSRYKPIPYFSLSPIEKISLNGFKYIMNSTEEFNIKYPNAPKGYIEFIPPCTAKIYFNSFNSTKKTAVIVNSIPTLPGKTRLIGSFMLLNNDDKNNNKNKEFDIFDIAFFSLKIPKWLLHVLTTLFAHQDAALLHEQEKNLNKKGYINYTDTYSKLTHTPYSQDIAIIAFRKWLHKYNNNNTIYYDDYNIHLNKITQKEDLFDVYNTHTKHCSVCMDALRNLKIIRNSLYFFGFISMELRTNENLNLFFMGLVLIGLGLALNRFIDLFYKYEFEHYLND